MSPTKYFLSMAVCVGENRCVRMVGGGQLEGGESPSCHM